MSDVMDEHKILEMARRDWLDVISRLWRAVDKQPDPKRLLLYGQELAGVPTGLLEKAVSRCIREHTYSNVPTIGEVWQAVRTELDNPLDTEQAIRNWCDEQWRKGLWRPSL